MAKQKKETNLGKDPVGRLLFRLAVPAITAQIVNVLYNMVDRMYIGHIPKIGAAALTGVGVTFPIIMVISAFAALMAMGGAPKASIMMGKGDRETAEKILGNCTSGTIAAGLILTVLLLIFGRDLLMLFGASENTIGYADTYMKIYACGTLFVQIALGLNTFITTQGFAGTSMLSVVIGAVTNIILDPIFIFGFDMGVSGAALATIISQALSAVWVLLFLTGKKTTLKIRKKYLKIDPRLYGSCLALGMSPFIMQATEGAITVCFNSSLLRYGGDIAVGAMTILSSVMQFSMLPLQGLTQGAQPIVSFNYGAGNMERVKKAFFLLLRACVIYSTLLWAVAVFVPQAFIMIFTSDADLSAYTEWAMRIYMAMSLIFGIQVACQQTFIALGNAKTSLFLAVLRKIILLIPLIFVLPLFFTDKAMAVFLAEPVADTLAVATTATMFFVQFRKFLKRMEKGTKSEEKAEA
ncbi:MATE family efflux transporter [Sellimonas sp.]|uniref:MATE family efflux transporter n=1 Tax=Sellimonas sp. TaxID=2021466 RepID=UPI000B387842|nr:MATE family efflux transporter [Sellimonas sp.]OUP01617.1 MATE family efflux transporter [Drancourtella sp. An210]OUP62700.1 MATE family efflux transporter [Drancourtella sp. An177]